MLLSNIIVNVYLNLIQRFRRAKYIDNNNSKNRLADTNN